MLLEHVVDDELREALLRRLALDGARGVPGYSVYSATKAAVRSLSRMASPEEVAAAAVTSGARGGDDAS